MHQSAVSLIVIFYIFVGVTLLVFNIFYMLGTKRKNTVFERRKAEEAELLMRAAREGTEGGAGYRKSLYKTLVREESLLAFDSALEKNMKSIPAKDIEWYFREYCDVFCDAAIYYRKRPAMERALFAHLLSVIPEKNAPGYRRLGELLLSYLENSTVYCRENVLQAMYRLGNEDVLERAFKLFQENGWYHSSKLIADGMASFNGDREKLARRLWPEKWDEEMKTALIQFMGNLPCDLSDLVLPELSSRNGEIRFAAARYFGRHVKAEAAPLLRGIVEGEEDAAAAAVRSLGKYPGEESRKTLMRAISSEDWYIRRNAAESLLELGLSEEEEARLLNHSDRYAREMFMYMRESRERK